RRGGRLGRRQGAAWSAMALAPPRRRTLRAGGLLQLIELQHLDAHRGLLLRRLALFRLLRALLPADLVEGLAHVRVEARTIVECGVEDVFHRMDFFSPTALCVLRRG